MSRPADPASDSPAAPGAVASTSPADGPASAPPQSLQGRRLLLVIAGGIAAYKALDLIRRLRERGATCRVVLTEAAQKMVTPMSVAALAGSAPHTDLWSLADETEIGHIRLARACDAIVVAPATAHILARMAAGLCDDLATTVLLATTAPILVAPAMNVQMWRHPATRATLATLQARGVRTVGPNAGWMAEAEWGPGRLAEPLEIVAAVEAVLAEAVPARAVPAESVVAEAVRAEALDDGAPAPTASLPLAGRHALVTSGPTHEPIDPVRYIANRSSGRQGHAIAAALAEAGARVTLVSGPVTLPDPAGVTVVPVESARDMLAACLAALPADIAVCAAAVADWRVDREADQKLKKQEGAGPPTLVMAENPDILRTLSSGAEGPRPRLVIGFAAETEHVLDHARAKLVRKGCDWILANDVSPATGTFGGDNNTLHLITRSGPGGDLMTESWPTLTKAEAARRLARQIAEHLIADPDPGPAPGPAAAGSR